MIAQIMMDAEPIIHHGIGVLTTSGIVAVCFRNPPLTRSENEKRIARYGFVVLGSAFIVAYILY